MGSNNGPNTTKGSAVGGVVVSMMTATEIKFLVWMVGIASLLGIINGYPTKTLNDGFLPNDVINLIFGIPLLLYSCSDAILLTGALLYQVYSSLTYVLALLSSWTHPKNPIFYFQLGAFYISSKALWSEFHTEHDKSSSRLSFHIRIGKYMRIYSGIILILWGLLFVLRASAGLLLRTIGIRDDVEAAIHVADILIGPSWIYGGFKFLFSPTTSKSSSTKSTTTTKTNHYHYQHDDDFNLLVGFSFLVQGSALFVALILLLLVRPYLLLEEDESASDDFNFNEILIVGAMGLTVIIPFLWVYNYSIISM